MQTLGEFIVKKEHDFPHATGDLTALLSAITLVYTTGYGVHALLLMIPH